MSFSTSPSIRALFVVAGIGFVGFSLSAGGGEKSGHAPVAPAKAEVVGHETELLKLTLTPEAEARLGLQYARATSGSARRNRMVHGEVMAPPAAGGVPVTAAQDLGMLASSQARADGEVGRLQAEVQVAQRAFSRAQALVQEGAGSQRVQDEAESVLGAARANLSAARAQRALLGPRLTGGGSTGVVWVRSAVFAADAPKVDRRLAATVQLLGDEGTGLQAIPVAGPPSSNPTAGTIDLYYRVSNPDGRLRLGERVSVALPVSGEDAGLVIPASAVLRDIHGGEWVYARIAPHTYERRRIETAAERNGQAVLARGLASGVEVVTAGAAELFGTEFGAK